MPANMELVVLGDAGLRSFLGHESVQALRELIKARQEPLSRVVDPLQLSLSLLGRPSGGTPTSRAEC